MATCRHHYVWSAAVVFSKANVPLLYVCVCVCVCPTKENAQGKGGLLSNVVTSDPLLLLTKGNGPVLL